MFKTLLKFFTKQNPDDLRQDVEEFESLSIEERIVHHENYFKRNRQTHPLMIPEYEAAKQINAFALNDKITSANLKEIIQIFNITNQELHFNGSGWVDFRGSILSLIVKNGYEYILLDNGNIELVLSK